MRQDLASLDAEKLALLANRGLVRRAVKMLESGEGPTWREDEAGLVVGAFADGVEIRWPPGVALADAVCSCGAHGACRHGVALALAYAPATASPAASWTPGALDDAALEAALGPRAVATARRWASEGLVVRIERGSPPTAHLPSGTVRFVAPDALHLAHCDVTGPGRDALIVAAAWAFREADARDPEASALEVALGQGVAAGHDVLVQAVDVVATVLDAGIAHLPETVRADLERVIDRSAAEGLLWVTGALEDLRAQWDAHRARSAAHSSVRAASLCAEVVARVRAARHEGTSRVLGAGVAPETRLEHVVLVGLGARVRRDGTVAVYLLDRSANVVLALERATGRLTLPGLATGELATRGARRSASRRVALSGERGGRRHALNRRASWDDIAAPVRVESVEALRAELEARPPRCLRPRWLAEDLRVVPIAAVHRIGWSPGAQELHALCSLPSGEPVRLELAHDPAAPGACGALQAALEGGCRHVAGHLRVEKHKLVMTPTAVSTPSGVVAPPLAAPRPVTAPVARLDSRGDPLTRALEVARARLADVAHLGLGHEGARRGVGDAADPLARVGLRAAAERARRVARGEGVEAWADAWLTLEVALERPR